jgi:UDP-GlcNAc:undecaprenyl-phosphate GlcNAc-1-phosphate transferase
MDNMNGLCAGLAAIASLVFGVSAAIRGEYLVAGMAFLCCGAFCGFLPYNFPRASSFLGDSGSHLAGYVIAVLAILPRYYSSKYPHALAVFTPLLVVALPLYDLASVVLIRWRLGRPFYVGDNNHLSHRLVRRGLTQIRAVELIWLGAMLLGGLSLLL